MTGLTRKRLLQLGAAIPAVGLAGYLLDAEEVAAGPLQATPMCDDGDDTTPELTEGPYFSTGSPRRRSLLTKGMRGTRLTITGYVLTTACKPVTPCQARLLAGRRGG